jgi:hypothetical protein
MLKTIKHGGRFLSRDFWEKGAFAFKNFLSIKPYGDNEEIKIFADDIFPNSAADFGSDS